MTRYAAFLRGVNVGGVNLKMADVAKVFAEAGFDDVKTVLASGNVLLDSASGATSVRRTAEAALREAFGYDAGYWSTDWTSSARSFSGTRSSATFPSTTPMSPSSATTTYSRSWPRWRPRPETPRPRATVSCTGRSPARRRWTRRSARRWARSATSRRPPPQSAHPGQSAALTRTGTFGAVSSQKIDASALTGVSETALLTLQVRANEARRPDAILDDPVAVSLADSIEFDFAKFGSANRQDMALRALTFDTATRAICAIIRPPPSSLSPRACRPASTASTPPA